MSQAYSIQKWSEHYSPNPAMLRHILVSEGYSVQQWGERPGTGIPNQKQDSERSYWVFSGSLEMTVERQGTFELEAGDRVFVPAGVYFSARVLGEEMVIYLVGEK